MNELKIKKIIDNNELNNIVCFGDLKNIFNISDESFDCIWSNVDYCVDSTPDNTVDYFLQIPYLKDVKGIEFAFLRLCINVDCYSFGIGYYVDGIKINSINIY